MKFSIKGTLWRGNWNNVAENEEIRLYKLVYDFDKKSIYKNEVALIMIIRHGVPEFVC